VLIAWPVADNCARSSRRNGRQRNERITSNMSMNDEFDTGLNETNIFRSSVGCACRARVYCALIIFLTRKRRCSRRRHWQQTSVCLPYQMCRHCIQLTALHGCPIVEVRADAICSAAVHRPLSTAARRLISVGGGTRFLASRRQRRGVLTPIFTPDTSYFYFLSSSLRLAGRYG
jgi:hypothetical protein